MANIHQVLETREKHFHKAEARAWDKLDELIIRQDDAESQIGTLIREGKEVFYVMPQGGRYREGTKRDLRDFLIRNRYA